MENKLIDLDIIIEEINKLDAKHKTIGNYYLLNNNKYLDILNND